MTNKTFPILQVNFEKICIVNHSLKEVLHVCHFQQQKLYLKTNILSELRTVGSMFSTMITIIIKYELLFFFTLNI